MNICILILLYLFKNLRTRGSITEKELKFSLSRGKRLEVGGQKGEIKRPQI